MASRKAIPRRDLSSSFRDRVLLLLANFVAFQQVVQFEPESILYPQEIRKVKDDAEYNLTDSLDENESE